MLFNVNLFHMLMVCPMFVPLSYVYNGLALTRLSPCPSTLNHSQLPDPSLSLTLIPAPSSVNPPRTLPQVLESSPYFVRRLVVVPQLTPTCFPIG